MTNHENPISQGKITETKKEIQKQTERFKIEIKGYEDLVEQIKEVEGLKIETVSPKISLAFLIEEMKKKNPEKWQDELKALGEKINGIKKTEGKTGVSWLLSECISSAYIEFLKERTNKVKDESLKRKLDMIRENAERWLEFNRNAHKQGQPVAFGGVSLDYAPEWYHRIEK